MTNLIDDGIYVENVQFSNATKISGLQHYIEVTEPYFALSNIRIFPQGVLMARIPIQNTSHLEVAGISLSEAGRHLAIMGSLALANENPCKEKHYYLATDALLERQHAEPFGGSHCSGMAKTISFNKKEGKVSALLYSDNHRLIYKAEIRYAILHERIYERMFRDKRQITPSVAPYNPYASNSRFEITNKDKQSCNGFIEKVKVEDCVGHFNNFPALPVARIAGAMVDLSGLNHQLFCESYDPFCVRRVEMHAEAFIFAGERVMMTTQLVQDNRTGETIVESYSRAGAECRAVEMKCWFFKSGNFLN